MTLTSKNSCLPALLLLVLVNFFFAVLGQEYHYHLMNEFPPGNSFFS